MSDPLLGILRGIADRKRDTPYERNELNEETPFPEFADDCATPRD
jgi:hypothetical protein